MENWKDKVLASIEGIERASAPENAFEKIQQKIQVQKIEERKLSPMQRLAAAASVALVIAGNVLFIISYQNNSEEIAQADSYSELISDFNIYSNED
jgi:hypothetical protein